MRPKSNPTTLLAEKHIYTKPFLLVSSDVMPEACMPFLLHVNLLIRFDPVRLIPVKYPSSFVQLRFLFPVPLSFPGSQLAMPHNAAITAPTTASIPPPIFALLCTPELFVAVAVAELLVAVGAAVAAATSVLEVYCELMVNCME
jgi:hypothetical protein